MNYPQPFQSFVNKLDKLWVWRPGVRKIILRNNWCMFEKFSRKIWFSEHPLLPEQHPLLLEQRPLSSTQTSIFFSYDFCSRTYGSTMFLMISRLFEQHFAIVVRISLSKYCKFRNNVNLRYLMPYLALTWTPITVSPHMVYLNFLTALIIFVVLSWVFWPTMSQLCQVSLIDEGTLHYGLITGASAQECMVCCNAVCWH